MKAISDESLVFNSIYLESEISCLCTNDNINFHEERACQTTQGILEEYRHAGRKRRCDMWFMFPALRGTFDHIGRDQ